MAGEIKAIRMPCLRGLDPDLRRRRILAARSFAVRSIPRHAILSGQWDGGSIVGSAGQENQHPSSRNKPDGKCPEWRHFGTPGEPGAFAICVGKKAAGRLLDGQLHDGYPA